jgi:pimeloyl-ACP methyl ester carboxylesterase
MTTRRGEFTTNDGVRLVFELGKGNRATHNDSPVVLVHGWSGSRRYYDDAFASLQQASNHPPLIVRYDLRGHGESDQPSWGHHVSRFAADLRDLINHLGLDNVTLVGASLGCAIIWSYFELFGSRKIKAAVFVDQAPLQNRAEDWSLGSKGCYDVVSLTRLQQLLKYDFMGFTKGNAESCLSNPIDPAYSRLLMAETMKADPVMLSTLMADHTALDWRLSLKRIDVPCLVLAGGKSQIFPVEGVKEVGRLIRGSKTIVFQHEDHWLYIEDFRRFSNLVADFAANGQLTDESVLSQLKIEDTDRLLGYAASSEKGSPSGSVHSQRASPGGGVLTQ